MSQACISLLHVGHTTRSTLLAIVMYVVIRIAYNTSLRSGGMGCYVCYGMVEAREERATNLFPFGPQDIYEPRVGYSSSTAQRLVLASSTAWTYVDSMGHETSRPDVFG